jgi:hypothetical protein
LPAAVLPAAALTAASAAAAAALPAAVLPAAALCFLRGDDRRDENEVEDEDEDEDEDEGIMAVNGNEAADGEVWEHNTRLVMTRRGAAS